jgi:hypothetical protein
MRRRRLLATIAGLAFLLALGAIVLWPSRSRTERISRANFDSIGRDMSPEQVAEILGPPNFSERELNKVAYSELSARIDLNWRLAETRAMDSLFPGLDYPGEYQHWNSKEGIISVKFSDGKAARKVWLQRSGAVRQMMFRFVEWFR